MSYLHRVIDEQLDQLLPHASAVAIEGPKAVGKTATAARRASTILRLDEDEGQALFAADPTMNSLPAGSILLDEWQKVPKSWDYVRRAVDDGAEPGRFLMTGSATPIAGTDTHSGAGRILSLRMRPLALFERRGWEPSISLADLFNGGADISGATDAVAKDYAHQIAASGFPSINDAIPLLRNQQLDSYLQRIVDRDLPEQGYVARDKAQLLSWLAAYAAASSTTTAYNEILDAATPGEGRKPAKKTTITYREKLSEIWMLDPVPAWDLRRSPFAGLAKSPKHQLADPAFVLRLLEVPEGGLLTPQFAHLAGPLFESLATLTVRVAAQASFGHVGHFRTSKGDREVDLIATDQNGSIVAIEVKFKVNIDDDDVKHLRWLKQQRPDDITDTVVLTTGKYAYRRSDGIAVIPLALLGP